VRLVDVDVNCGAALPPRRGRRPRRSDDLFRTKLRNCSPWWPAMPTGTP